MSAARSGCSRSRKGTGSQPRAGARCCCTSRAAAWRPRPSWPSATARWASGPRWRRSTPRPASNAAGCTRPPTCSIDCPRACNARQSRPAGDLDGGHPGRGRAGVRLGRHDLSRQVSEGGRVVDQGSRAPTDLLRLPAEHWRHLRTTNPLAVPFRARASCHSCSSLARSQSSSGAGSTASSISRRSSPACAFAMASKCAMIHPLKPTWPPPDRSRPYTSFGYFSREHPASGSRSGLLSATARVRQGGVTHTNEPPRFPERFTETVRQSYHRRCELCRFLTEATANCRWQ